MDDSCEQFLKNLLPAQQEFLQAMKKAGIERDIPNISWNTALYLRDFLRDKKPTHILEIGPANGFSTMILSLACAEATITSIEFSRHAFEELRQNIRTFSSLTSSDVSEPANLPPNVTSNIFQEKIDNFQLYFADARELLPAFLKGEKTYDTTHPKSHLVNISKRRFDIIFIDGAFRMTKDFFLLSRPILAEGGLVIVDDVVKYRWKMESFYELLSEKKISYEIVNTDPDDGIMIVC